MSLPDTDSSSLLLYIGVAALVVWRIGVRIRRMVARQALTRWRPRLTVLLFAFSLLILMAAEIAHPLNDLALLIGAVIGAGLGVYGLQLTRFERTPMGVFYTPNAYLGIGLSLLLIGRLAYRLVPLLSVGDLKTLTADDFARSPLTLALIGLLAAYYLTYAIGLLRWRDEMPEAAVTGQKIL